MPNIQNRSLFVDAINFHCAFLKILVYHERPCTIQCRINKKQIKRIHILVVKNTLFSCQIHINQSLHITHENSVKLKRNLNGYLNKYNRIMAAESMIFPFRLEISQVKQNHMCLDLEVVSVALKN